MRIVCDGVIYGTIYGTNGGVSRLYRELLPRLCEMDESVRIRLLLSDVAKGSLPAHPRILKRAIPQVVKYVRPRRLWGSFIPQLQQLVSQMCFGSGKGSIWHSTYYTRPGRWKGTSVVIVYDMIHELFPELFNSGACDEFRKQKRLCVEEASAVLCITDATRQDLCNIYGIEPAKISIIPLGCKETFQKLSEVELSVCPEIREPFFLYIGTRSYHKNFAGLLEAYGSWSGKNDVRLVVAGRAWSPEEEIKLAELGIQDRVCCLRNVDDLVLCQLFNQAVAFVYPSIYEGFGIPLLEAMASGCPVIASRIPSTIEVAADYPIFFDPTSKEELISAFELALADGRNPSRIGQGLRRVKHFSWNNTASQVLRVYKSLCC